MGNTLKRHPFSGQIASIGELLHTLSGFRLPWPPSDCLERFTPFVVSDERVFRRLNLAFGSSRIASSATKSGPLEALIRMPIVQLSDKGFLHI